MRTLWIATILLWSVAGSATMVYQGDITDKDYQNQAKALVTSAFTPWPIDVLSMMFNDTNKKVARIQDYDKTQNALWKSNPTLAKDHAGSLVLAYADFMRENANSSLDGAVVKALQDLQVDQFVQLLRARLMPFSLEYLTGSNEGERLLASAFPQVDAETFWDFVELQAHFGSPESGSCEFCGRAFFEGYMSRALLQNLDTHPLSMARMKGPGTWRRLVQMERWSRQQGEGYLQKITNLRRSAAAFVSPDEILATFKTELGQSISVKDLFESYSVEVARLNATYPEAFAKLVADAVAYAVQMGGFDIGALSDGGKSAFDSMRGSLETYGGGGANGASDSTAAEMLSRYEMEKLMTMLASSDASTLTAFNRFSGSAQSRIARITLSHRAGMVQALLQELSNVATICDKARSMKNAQVYLACTATFKSIVQALLDKKDRDLDYVVADTTQWISEQNSFLKMADGDTGTRLQRERLKTMATFADTAMTKFFSVYEMDGPNLHSLMNADQLQRLKAMAAEEAPAAPVDMNRAPKGAIGVRAYGPREVLEKIDVVNALEVRQGRFFSTQVPIPMIDSFGRRVNVRFFVFADQIKDGAALPKLGKMADIANDRIGFDEFVRISNPLDFEMAGLSNEYVAILQGPNQDDRVVHNGAFIKNYIAAALKSGVDRIHLEDYSFGRRGYKTAIALNDLYSPTQALWAWEYVVDQAIQPAQMKIPTLADFPSKIDDTYLLLDLHKLDARLRLGKTIFTPKAIGEK